MSSSRRRGSVSASSNLFDPQSVRPMSLVHANPAPIAYRDSHQTPTRQPAGGCESPFRGDNVVSPLPKLGLTLPGGECAARVTDAGRLVQERCHVEDVTKRYQKLQEDCVRGEQARVRQRLHRELDLLQTRQQIRESELPLPPPQVPPMPPSLAAEGSPLYTKLHAAIEDLRQMTEDDLWHTEMRRCDRQIKSASLRKMVSDNAAVSLAQLPYG